MYIFRTIILINVVSGTMSVVYRDTMYVDDPVMVLSCGKIKKEEKFGWARRGFKYERMPPSHTSLCFIR